ncbi:esterase [Hydrogenophaga crassostreae]|uniref:Esterase n=1 Tax=Hydrogenophaga crassostreae TaxID=1763535 RepID=A0A162P7I7_9BURK|nr:tannase/feruloyl esterase family alpha/beta hydrolase [Hydrogenophaga crassostreae]AOW14153.1 esterase [Hydrogenophaga crassostreae]OAD42124.1 esterase [Hydrogenophaga crassostreae]
MTNIPGKLTFGAASMVLLSACAHGPANDAPALAAARGATLQQCEILASRFSAANTVIESAVSVGAGELKQAGQPIAAHCLVMGQMHARQGTDGQTYAIGFEMRLPKDWAGRFYYQANGGLDGSVKTADGALPGGQLTGALKQGFAVISSDAGHTGKQTVPFGAEPQARLDYGYQAVAKLTPMAKALIASAYGKAPDRSYIGGCSNGGRHAMVAASRLTDAYDGYLVGAPGYQLPLAALAQIRSAQIWAPLAMPGATVPHPMVPNVKLPDLGSAFTSAERTTLSQALLTRCDALDGAKDGLIHDVQACQRSFKLDTDVATCEGARNGQCLTADQKLAIGQIFGGVHTPAGKRIYSPFPLDAGVSGDNWATWKFVNALALDPLAAGAVFSAPPGRVDPVKDDTDARLALFSATTDVYKESALALMTPPGHENPAYMGALAQRGGKLIAFHGVSDPIFSAEDTRAWVERAGQIPGASGAIRYFPVPGMNHCSGGPATDQFDLLGPLVKWVEEGVAPQAVLATARGAANAGGANEALPANWSANRTRPLCAYPTVATYNGQGSIESASSFTCR